MTYPTTPPDPGPNEECPNLEITGSSNKLDGASPVRPVPCDPTPPASPPCLPRPRTDSRCSLGSITTSSLTYASHKEYMDSLVPPSTAEFEKIATVQKEREAEMKQIARRARRDNMLQGQGQHQLQGEDRQSSNNSSSSSSSDRKSGKRRMSIEAFKFRRAAKLIQRTYRGYRLRREMKGFGLDASTRWVSAIQEAQFREMTRPLPRIGFAGSDGESVQSHDDNGSTLRGMTARDKWKKAAVVARRANRDDEDSDLSSLSSEESDETPEQKAERRKRREEAIHKRKETSMMMGLQYFLEMVDQKHRYGSNLRVYHEEWKRRETHENFFYWLDYGEGRFVEMAACPRDRLERELVRYLSREERQYYLVTVDDEGRLCWAKDGSRIDTSEDFRDSTHGIVPIDDSTPEWSVPEDRPPPSTAGSNGSRRSAASIESALEADRAAKYATPEFDNAKPHNKIMKISAGTIFDKLLRKTVRKNTWIFVADTNFRLYVGIKASGAFQHSSFLQGGRISAAGLIKVRDGRLASLSPLSGHYRPPASNFRAFIRSMKDAGVDVSHVSVSKSYAVLVGLETYMKTRKKGKHAIERLTAKKDKIVAPEEVARREEDEKDKSESAAREREVLEEEARREEEEIRANSKRAKVVDKLRSVRDGEGEGDAVAEERGAAEEERRTATSTT